MGSLSKFLGRISALSLESQASNIIRTIKPNKIVGSLSQRLDTTLKDSHDMKVFGMGTLSSMADRERYARFTQALYGVYATMEDELDRCSASRREEGGERPRHPVAYFWERHAGVLRRADRLKRDWSDVAGSTTSPTAGFTAGTTAYMEAVRSAGEQDRADGGGRLLGHAYTRYLADLMGGQYLGTPTRLALGLRANTPTQYTFSFPVNRRKYVEDIYEDLNEAGEMMEDDDAKERVVAEARLAFRHNIKVYSEEPYILDSLKGLKNIAGGWMFQR